MKRTLMLAVIAALFCAGTAFAAAPAAGPAKTEAGATAKPKCDDCPMHKKMAGKKCAAATCPENIKGVETVSRNTENGVEITMTAKDEETAARVQELAVVHYGPKAEKCPGCPTAVPGARTAVENIPGGVKVTVTGKTPETVKAIQKASVREHGAAAPVKSAAKARKMYVCPMGDYEGSKPGKCPKCGMTLVEKK